MAGFVEIVAIAFVAQLLVLPGEKVQFIIAGLATKYHPLLVVGAAGTAFAAWTAVEITFGAAVRGILPRAVMNVVTAILVVYRGFDTFGEIAVVFAAGMAVLVVLREGEVA